MSGPPDAPPALRAAPHCCRYQWHGTGKLVDTLTELHDEAQREMEEVGGFVFCWGGYFCVCEIERDRGATVGRAGAEVLVRGCVCCTQAAEQQSGFERRRQ